MKRVHFFDVDNTITSSVTSIQYLFTGIKKRFFPIRPFLSVPGLMKKYKAGKFSIDTIYRDGIPFLVGKSRESLRELANVAFLKRIKKDIFPGIFSKIKQLKEEGEQVVIASSAIDIVIEPLIRYLGVEEMICSSLLFNNEICTGKFKGIPAFEDEKKRLVLEYIKRNNLEPGECYFYSDSIHDLPLLQAVGHPMVVNPDRKLRRFARERNWQIVGCKN